MPSGREFRPGRVRVRYRRSDGQFADTTLDRVPVDDVMAGLPVREFRSYKGRQHYSGWYWSATLRRLVVYESRLELARIMLADFDPYVTGIAAQPFLLTGADGSRVRRHVPDLLLAGADGGVTVVDGGADRFQERRHSEGLPVAAFVSFAAPLITEVARESFFPGLPIGVIAQRLDGEERRLSARPE